MKFVGFSVIVVMFSFVTYAQEATDLRGRVTDSNGVVANATVTLVLQVPRPHDG